ncbi:MAG: NYN domain-containing protein, partial [Hyphomicrobiaceae bacterium]
MSLSTVFVDYDNIYLSLKRKNEEAARRFAKDAPLWLGELANGKLITPTNGPMPDVTRRIVMNRCYGNPVPRRNSADNSTDMNSFPFVRHHFLRSGFEVVDCPPLTAQLKNSSDIRMVMDIRDFLNHDTYFDEFIILSGDADFTPLLHRLRAHARRTVIFANDYTAQPYTAISDGEVRESDLIALLMDGRSIAAPEGNDALPPVRAALPGQADVEANRRDIIKEVIESVRSAGQPVPLEALADRAVRDLGHERTVGTAWGGTGGFRELLSKALPAEIRLSDQPPYFV